MNKNINKEYEPMIQKKIEKEDSSKLGNYMELIVGRKGFFAFLKYEIIISLLMDLPGAMGIFLRGFFYRFLFKKVGRGVIFGKSITFRNPNKISLGNGVIIDEYCMLDAKGKDNTGIVIKDNAYIGRNTILSCKNGNIFLDTNVNIGFNCELYSLNSLEIGKNTLIAAYCYIIGGGHNADKINVPFRDQEKHAFGIKIENNVWLGTKCIIMDNCNIGESSIIGAAAVVTKNIPSFSIAAGIPARVIKKRQ